MKKNIILSTITFLIAPFVASAHAGHGAFQDSSLHYLTSAEHALPLGIAAAVFFFLVRRKFIKGKNA